MDLRRKLARLDGAGPGSTPFLPPDDPDTARRARIEQLRTLIRRATLTSGPGPDVSVQRSDWTSGPGPNVHRDGVPGTAAVFPGEVRETPFGRVHVVERWLEPHHCHGRVRVADALRTSLLAIAHLSRDPELERVDPAGMLYVDTETTGLHGGAGTLPFLVGLAWFEDESLRLQQLFLRRPGEEAPMLHLLAERLRAASCIVSYNGKSFDWPLLRTRFVMNRVPMPEPPPHLDLLHCARRVLKPRLGAVRLVRVESEVLGMRREDDVDGCDIPGIYLRWLRSGEPSPLVPVIEHNANDLIALAALLARLSCHYATLRADDDPRDHLAYARIALHAGDVDRAHDFATAAADGGGDPCVTLDALLLVARIARRRKEVMTEETILTRALAETTDLPPDLRARVRLRLAKLFEHRLRDPVGALAHAAHTAPAEGPEAHARRIARLSRRIERRKSPRRADAT